MLSLRNRFGIPGVISVIALVFAMLGGTYAASNNSGAGKATASAKAKKGPRGPKGATGPAGPAGPAGAKGDAGANGVAGGVGPAGPTGAKGATGATGATGFSGFTETLPSGKTEMGAWSFEKQDGGEPFALASISFSIPLASELAASKVHLIAASGKELVLNTEEFETEEVEPTGCGNALTPPGTVASPKAAPGNLCVYLGAVKPAGQYMGSNLIAPPSTACEGADCSAAGPGAGTTGAVLHALPGGGGTAYGSWAVTAP